jgi:protein tyrosine phosphatase
MSSSSSCCIPRKQSLHFVTARDDFEDEDDDEAVETTSVKEQFLKKAGCDVATVSPYLVMESVSQAPPIDRSPKPTKTQISLEVATANFEVIKGVFLNRSLVPFDDSIDRSQVVFKNKAFSCVYVDNRITVPRSLDTKSSEHEEHQRINASPFLGSMPYVLTQAPLQNTLVDFVRMVIFYNTRIIISLTNPMEMIGGKKKERCFDYWGSDVKGSGFSIIRKKTAFTIDQGEEILHISKLCFSIDGVAHKVFHYWFENWRDGDGANSALLRKMSSFLRQHHAKLGGTVTVHCSVGLGRTGTYVAIHEGIACVKRFERVSVPALIWRLREARPYMVLSSQQYVCIHNTIYDYLQEEV